MNFLRLVPIFLLIGCQTANIDAAYKDAQEDAGCEASCQLRTDAAVAEVHCPSDMIEVKGNYCPQVDQKCLEYDEKVVNANGKVRCLRFAETKCLSKTRKPMHYCIDKYEYPNKVSEIPVVMVTWNEMKKSCEAEGKRLCRDVEWEFACEGEEALPYPYGYERGTDICNIDHPWRAFDGAKLMDPKTRQAEVDRLSQRVPSGSMSACVSPFGVYDMTGNVDESVINSSGKPYKSGEKGGHWAIGARNRCRPMTTVHNEDFAFYEIGGRCCKDSL